MSELPDMGERGAPRVTPWSLVFGAPAFDQTRFEQIRAEATDVAEEDAGAMFLLPAAGALLRELVPDEGGREAVAQVRALIFAAYHFWRHGCNVYRISEKLLHDMLRVEPGPAAVPHPAGYLQLPRNVFWARIAEVTAAEPVDGFFWNVGQAGRAAPVDLVFALGVRPGRPGLTLFDVRLETMAQLAGWGAARVRGDGADFANILPGGELQNYLGLTTGAEALKLAALCLAAISTGTWHGFHADGQLIHEAADG